MATFWTIVYFALYVYFLFLLARLIVGWVMVFARNWRPSGLVAAGLEVVYAATDPPLKALQRVIPPLNLGTVRLDLGFMVLLIIVFVLRDVAGSLVEARRGRERWTDARRGLFPGIPIGMVEGWRECRRLATSPGHPVG